MKTEKKAALCLTGGLVMVVDFLLLPVAYVLGARAQPLLLTGAIALILAPLVAWRVVEKFARDDAGYYNGWEVDWLTKVGRWMMFRLNLLAWFVLSCVWVGRRAYALYQLATIDRGEDTRHYGFWEMFGLWAVGVVLSGNFLLVTIMAPVAVLVFDLAIINVPGFISACEIVIGLAVILPLLIIGWDGSDDDIQDCAQTGRTLALNWNPAGWAVQVVLRGFAKRQSRPVARLSS